MPGLFILLYEKKHPGAELNRRYIHCSDVENCFSNEGKGKGNGFSAFGSISRNPVNYLVIKGKKR